MRLNNYLTEFSREQYGKGITFVDIDETMFNTFARVLVKKDGKVVRDLDNQEYNSYRLKDGEEFDFGQFRDAAFFRKTSIPIPTMFARVKKMIAQIKAMDSGSKIVFLTARGEFTKDPKEFKKAFADHGINIDGKTVEASFMPEGSKSTIDADKKRRILEYISSGEYRRVRLIDDHKPNLKALKDIEKNLPKKIEDNVINKYNLDMSTEKLPAISFYALWIDDKGNLHQV
jgi:hypothetical protein